MRHLLGALIVVSTAARATAQPSISRAGSSSALAEQLFDQARELVKANRWAEACPRFEASMRYDPVVGTQLNLATCYEHIGKLASAWGLYRDAIALARRAGDTKRVDYAQRHAAALEPRLPRLAIVAPAKPVPGLIIRRDDTALDAAMTGVALYVDPGPHSVTASAPGFGMFAVSILLVESETEVVTIPALVAAPPSPPRDVREAALRPAIHASAAPRAGTGSYAALGIGGAGAVAIGVGVVFGLKARSSNNDAKALCGADLSCGEADYSRGKQLVSDARGSATISTVALVCGAAASAAAAMVYFTASGTAKPRTARVVPIGQNGGAAIALTGTF